MDCQQSIDKLVTLKDNLQRDYNALEKERDELLLQNLGKVNNFERKIADLEGEKVALHEKYINILTASIKKYIDGNDEVADLPEMCENAKEFRMQVESVLRLILDFKLKTESLEKELFEKAKMVAEKNYEIEKLLRNSEILSQEVITKTQTIKDYEIECSELMKNNDMLIGELENYKSSSGLQTISESNEDNMVLLESQLEGANKKIAELESELDSIKNQYKILDEQHKSCNSEKDELIENNEYKCTELKVLQDGFKEDLERYEKICADLTTTNKQLTATNKEYEIKLDVCEKQAEELHKKLLNEEELRTQLQVEKNSLTEKLQSFKMAETSLKLHFNNELQMAVEAKQEIEGKLSVVSAQLQEKDSLLEETRKQFEELKYGNEDLLNKNVELLERLKVGDGGIESPKLSVSATQTWSSSTDETADEITHLRNETNQLQTQLNELIALVNTKQQENITYHTEIQRLNQILAQEIEKSEKLTDQNAFLQQKCSLLTQNLLQQQGLEKELERLRVHLVEIEEAYTQELLQAERKHQECQAKMLEIEEREKNSSTLYTSVSIRANQQVEALQNQIQVLMGQRDELRQKISDAEDENSRQAAALTNLNFVLEQFQRGLFSLSELEFITFYFLNSNQDFFLLKVT